MNTYGRYNVALVKGKGCVAWDEDGKRYLDVSSGIGVNALGYCDEGWVKAVTEQAGTIQHMSNYFYSSQPSQLAEKLCTLTPFTKVCFGNSGSQLFHNINCFLQIISIYIQIVTDFVKNISPLNACFFSRSVLKNSHNRT